LRERFEEMDKQSKQQMLLHRLVSLADQPQEQVRSALELLKQERGIQVVSAALSVLTSVAVPEARPVLLRLYAYYDEAPLKRDAGGRLRGLILKALQPIAHATDRSLAEHAAMTYEFLAPKKEECAGGLRIAGLSLLETTDVVLASYHCVRLLNDPYTSRMSGEPALSAVRFLANQGQFLPLYGFLVSNLLQDELLSSLRAGPKSSAEVMGECLRSLAQAPPSVVDDLFARYLAYSPATMMLTYETKEDVELVGFFDLLLAQTPQRTYLDFLESFLCKTARDELYQYVIALLVAHSHPELRRMLLTVARQEQSAHRIEILLSAFTLIQHDPVVTSLIQELQQRQRLQSKGG
jgi:hypothetical protein